LVSPEEYESSVKKYCAQVGSPPEKASLFKSLRELLTKAAVTADSAFPENEYLRIEGGKPILSRLEKRAEPESLKLVEQLLAERLPPVNILDAANDTVRWLHWTRFFGPISGHEAKISDAVLRYVATVFCYGCNLGPSQTARSMSDVDRRQIGWINQRHITEDHLDQAITVVIDGCNRFLLPTLWVRARAPPPTEQNGIRMSTIF
jgi:Tn3 transposase DDE domain